VVAVGGRGSDLTGELLELGMLECSERFEKDFAQIVGVMGELSRDTSVLGEKTNAHTARIARIKREDSGNRELIRLALRDAANDLQDYAKSLDEQTSVLAETADDALATMKRVIVLWPSFFDEHSTNEIASARTTRDAIETLRDTIAETRNSMTSFRDSVDGTPPLSTDIIKAKGRAYDALSAHIKFLTSFESDLRSRADELGEVIDNYSTVVTSADVALYPNGS
jgi:hypothetical protein